MLKPRSETGSNELSDFPYLRKRGATWFYVRRVPSRFQAYDKRRIVKITTTVKVADDPHGSAAAAVAKKIDKETVAFWNTLVNGTSAEGEKQYKAAVDYAQRLGFQYLSATEISAKLPANEVAKRVAVVKSASEPVLPVALQSLLGGVDVPEIKASQLFEKFAELQKANTIGMSKDQVRRWRNPRIKVVREFVECVGDKPLRNITNSDALMFRQQWVDRVQRGEVKVDTANKQFNYLNAMFRSVNKTARLGLDDVFAGMAIGANMQASRNPWTNEDIERNLLNPENLAGLNDEARAILLVMVETGLRPSEICGLLPKRIHLDAPVPYVEIRPDIRRIKTRQSERDMPLVGVSLEAMKQFPEGFPRYRTNSATLSATVNNYLLANKLRKESVTMYGLRHSFEDRLTAVDAPEKMIAMLMGHRHQRPKYGKGAELEHKQEWLERIAFKTKKIPPRADRSGEE